MIRRSEDRIGIVILNYTSYRDTIKLIEELQHQSIIKDLQIVIVDNASPNDSYDKLKPLEKVWENVVVIKTTQNLGYAKGNNYGLNYLDEHMQPEYVAILNNDVMLPEHCFEKLIEKYRVLENPAIVAPKQLDVHGREISLYPLNSFLDDCLSLFLITKLLYKHRTVKFKDTSGKGAMKVEVVPGSFMFSSFQTFKSMGFFYPNTFLFAEERFISAKAKRLNLHNYILLEETYIHAHSKTINTVFNQVGKYKMLYTGWLEYTRECRKHGKIKAVVLKFLMRLSLIELYVLDIIRNVLRNFR